MVLLKCSTVRTSFADLAGGTEVNVGILSAGWLDIVQLNLFRARLREVACLDLEAFAEKRWINSWSSLIFSSLLPVGFLHLLDDQLAGLTQKS